MKKLALIASILIHTYNCSAQKFTLTELLKITSMNSEQFDTYVTSRGYYYSKVNETGAKIYKLYERKISGEYSLEFLASSSDEYNSFISFTTHFQKDYLEIKKKLKVAGFNC